MKIIKQELSEHWHDHHDIAGEMRFAVRHAENQRKEMEKKGGAKIPFEFVTAWFIGVFYATGSEMNKSAYEYTSKLAYEEDVKLAKFCEVCTTTARIFRSVFGNN